MPWALNDATRRISPTKTLEYMAAGKPIVSTAVADVVRDHGDLVFVADGPAHFVELATGAAAGFDEGRAAAERRRAAEHSWDAVAEAMRRLVAERLEAAGRGPTPRARRPAASRPAAPAA